MFPIIERLRTVLIEGFLTVLLDYAKGFAAVISLIVCACVIELIVKYVNRRDEPGRTRGRSNRLAPPDAP